MTTSPSSPLFDIRCGLFSWFVWIAVFSTLTNQVVIVEAASGDLGDFCLTSSLPFSCNGRFCSPGACCCSRNLQCVLGASISPGNAECAGDVEQPCDLDGLGQNCTGGSCQPTLGENSPCCCGNAGGGGGRCYPKSLPESGQDDGGACADRGGLDGPCNSENTSDKCSAAAFCDDSSESCCCDVQSSTSDEGVCRAQPPQDTNDRGSRCYEPGTLGGACGEEFGNCNVDPGCDVAGGAGGVCCCDVVTNTCRAGIPAPSEAQDGGFCQARRDVDGICSPSRRCNRGACNNVECCCDIRSFDNSTLGRCVLGLSNPITAARGGACPLPGNQGAPCDGHELLCLNGSCDPSQSDPDATECCCDNDTKTCVPGIASGLGGNVPVGGFCPLPLNGTLGLPCADGTCQTASCNPTVAGGVECCCNSAGVCEAGSAANLAGTTCSPAVGDLGGDCSTVNCTTGLCGLVDCCCNTANVTCVQGPSDQNGQCVSKDGCHKSSSKSKTAKSKGSKGH